MEPLRSLPVYCELTEMNHHNNLWRDQHDHDRNEVMGEQSIKTTPPALSYSTLHHAPCDVCYTGARGRLRADPCRVVVVTPLAPLPLPLLVAAGFITLTPTLPLAATYNDGGDV